MLVVSSEMVIERSNTIDSGPIKGENPSSVYSMTRMDTGWNFRHAYDTARQMRDKQDILCVKAKAGAWKELGDSTFPEDLQWEALVDVLRGRVKLAVHCYEVRIIRTTTQDCRC